MRKRCKCGSKTADDQLTLFGSCIACWQVAAFARLYPSDAPLPIPGDKMSDYDLVVGIAESLRDVERRVLMAEIHQGEIELAAIEARAALLRLHRDRAYLTLEKWRAELVLMNEPTWAGVSRISSEGRKGD